MHSTLYFVVGQGRVVITLCGGVCGGSGHSIKWTKECYQAIRWQLKEIRICAYM